MPNSIDHEIATIIYTACGVSGSFAAECPGGIRWNLHKQPPDGSAISEPYAVFLIHPSAEPILSTGGATVVRRLIEFRVTGNEGLAAAACGRLRSIFHTQTLTNPTGGTFLACLEAPGGESTIPMWARDSLMKWQAEWFCEIWCQF